MNRKFKLASKIAKKKNQVSFIAFLLLFSMITSTVSGATVESSPKTWNPENYVEVLYRYKWENKDDIQLLDNSTGQTYEITIPSINIGTLTEEDFSINLPEYIVLLNFNEELNPYIVVTENSTVLPLAVETLLDVGAFSISLWEFTTNPDFWTGTAVVLDGASILLPFVPAVGGLTINAIK